MSVEAFVSTFHLEINQVRAASEALRNNIATRHAAISNKLDGLYEEIADGLLSPGLLAKLKSLEAEKADLERDLAEPAPSPVRLHPDLAGVYRRKVEDLGAALNDSAIRDCPPSAVNYLSHGVAKDPALDERRPRNDASEPNGERRPRQRKRRSGLRLTSTLKEAIHRAIGYANARKHELATLEHLLLALVDEPDASEVMQACAVDLPKLRSTLRRFVDDELDELFSDIEGFEASPSTGFQRVIQRAAIHVHSSGRSEVTGANVLVAIFNERESHAALFCAALSEWSRLIVSA